MLFTQENDSTHWLTCNHKAESTRESKKLLKNDKMIYKKLLIRV